MEESPESRMQQILDNGTRLPSLLTSYFTFYCYRAYAIAMGITSTTSTDPPILDFVGAFSQCRYRLDNDTSATLTLPDGRKLGYAQYGLQDSGKTVIYAHGLPGSRIEAASMDAIASRLGARIIAVDRPGYGWSTPHPERTILDHAKDIECLANHLKLDRYGVLGISGGGPYALACAASLPPDKLKCVSIVCGLGPPNVGKVGMSWTNWLGFTFGHRYFPALVRLWFSRDPLTQLKLSDEKRLELVQRNFLKSNPPQKDIDGFKQDPDLLPLLVYGARETYRQGFDGLSQDGRLLSMDFGFRIEDMCPDLPVQLWYGKLDTSVPPSHGEQIALRLGARAHLRVEDETHTSLVINCRDQYLEELTRAI